MTVNDEKRAAVARAICRVIRGNDVEPDGKLLEAADAAIEAAAEFDRQLFHKIIGDN